MNLNISLPIKKTNNYYDENIYKQNKKLSFQYNCNKENNSFVSKKTTAGQLKICSRNITNNKSCEFLPKNFIIKNQCIFLEIGDKKMLNKIKNQINFLSGHFVTRIDIDKGLDIKICLIVTDHNEIISNITKKELVLYMPYPLVKIKNIKEIPICPAHYFQSYINLQVESANKISSVRKEKVYKNSNKIFLTKNFIKIQQRRIVERVAIYQTNSIDNFIVLNLSNNSLSSAFGNKNINETTPLRGKNKVLKTSGYCEFCKVSLQDRFNHCEEDTHKQNMIKNKKLFDELDKEIGFICEDGKNLMSFNFS